MTEYSKISEGVLTATAATPVFVRLPYKPKFFEIWNTTEWGSANATPQVQYGFGFSDEAANRAYISRNATGNNDIENAILTSGGFRFFDGGDPAFGPTVSTNGSVSQAAAASVNIDSHGFVTGDTVWLFGTTGMLQIAGIPYTITVTGANTFTIPVNSSGFAAAATAAQAKLWYPLAIPNLAEPYLTYITAISTGTSTTITTSVDHAFVVGQQVSFVLPEEWGMSQLNGLTGFVTSVPTSNSIVVDINSSAFTAFAYPTSAVAAAGVTFPQVIPVGDLNFGFSGPTISEPITIPGAFSYTTSAGVLIGASLLTNVSGGGATIRWRAEYPDQFTDDR